MLKGYAGRAGIWHITNVFCRKQQQFEYPWDDE
jgi:hypothetical protein